MQTIQNIVDRLKHWKTTTMGVAGGAAIIVLAKSFHCELPNDWMTWATATIPLVLGALAKDS